jgi:hypothetical protein
MDGHTDIKGVGPYGPGLGKAHTSGHTSEWPGSGTRWEGGDAISSLANFRRPGSAVPMVTTQREMT